MKCINNEGLEDFLTVGKGYQVLSDKLTHWKMISDNNIVIVVGKERFESEVEEVEICD